MLQLGSRSFRALSSSYVCASCTNSVLQPQAASIASRSYGTAPKPASPEPQTERTPRSASPKIPAPLRPPQDFQIWKELLYVLDRIKKEEATGRRTKPVGRGLLSGQKDVTGYLSATFKGMAGRPIEKQLTYLTSAIPLGQLEHRTLLETKLSEIRTALNLQNEDDVTKLSSKVKDAEKQLLLHYRRLEAPTGRLQEQLQLLKHAIFKRDRKAMLQLLERLQETLRNTDAREFDAQINPVQRDANDRTKKNRTSEDLLVGALSALDDILSTKTKPLSEQNGAEDLIDDEIRQSSKLRRIQSVPRGPTTDAVANTKTANVTSKAVSKSQSNQKPRVSRELGLRRPRRAGAPRIPVEKVDTNSLRLNPIEISQPPVPKLQYGLDRVLFNPGVYHLQDPRSRVYNFDPYLATIMPIDQFDFNALKEYVTSSKDENLISIAAQLKKKYSGSTSSMTAMLSHFHYLLSSWRPINPAHTSRSFEPESLNFTRIMRAPAAAFLHWKNGTYAIDADKEFDSANILSMLGKSMEKLLTLPKEDYEKYRRVNSDQLTEEERNADDSFHYTTMGDFMMRSQLDAHDSRLPGSGMFDLKTRAVVSIRMDAKDFHKGLGYEIRHRIGQWESYEREYFDMIRSAFLKYSLQVRMGRMDGIFVAFHNTQRIFGFQYVSLDEMDLALHGTDNRSLGDREFKISLQLLNKALDRATAKFPGRSLRLHIETRVGVMPFTYIFAKPVDTPEIEAVQTANKESIEAFERNILSLGSEDQDTDSRIEEEEDPTTEAALENNLDETKTSELAEQDSEEVWEHMRAVVEQTIENEASGLETIRETLQDALKQSGLLRSVSPEESSQYVDALLEALNPSDVAKQAEDVQEDAFDLADTEENPEGAEASAAASSTKLTLDDAADSADDLTSDADLLTTDQPTSIVDEQSSKGSADSRSLRDLILSLAAKAEAGRLQNDEETTSDDAGLEESSTEQTELRKFATILSDMINKSRESDSDADEISSPESKMGETLQPTVDGEEPADSMTPPDEEEIFGMILTVRNQVNGHYIPRPEKLTAKDKWMVSYSFEEIPSHRAKTIYQQMKKRRKVELSNSHKRGDEWAMMYKGALGVYSRKGLRFRQEEIKKARTKPVHVYGHHEPLAYEKVFGREKSQQA